MPPIHYWLSGYALFLAGSFALTAILGIMGIKHMMSKKPLVVSYVLTILLFALGWRGAAIEQQENEHKAEILSAISQKLDVPTSKIMDKLNHLIAQTEKAVWPTLDRSSAEEIRSALSALPRGPIAIACASPNCKALSDQLLRIFKAAGWQPRMHHGGGLGVDGVLGLTIYSCNRTAFAIKNALEVSGRLHVNVKDDSATGCHDNDFFVVGERPF